MEKFPAFESKKKKDIIEKVPEVMEKPLRSLEEDKNRIKSFNFTLNAILAGDIATQDQLRLFVNPRFITYDGGQLALLDRGGNYLRIKNKIIFKKDIGTGLDEEQFETLLDILTEKFSVSKEKETVEGKIKSFNFTLNAILAGDIATQDQLRLFVNPRFITYDGGQLALLDRGGNYLRIKNKIIFKKDIGTGLDEEQYTLILRLLTLFNNPACPEEIKQNFKEYVRTGKLETLSRMKIIMADAGNDDITSEVSEIVNEIIKTRRILNLKQEVYGGIDNGFPLEDISKRLVDFEGKETSDLELVAQLQRVISAKKRENIVSSAGFNLNPRLFDADLVISIVNPLLISSNPRDKEIGLNIVETAYALELVKWKEQIQEQVNGRVNPEQMRIIIDSLSPRPSVGDIDYIKTIVETRKKVFAAIDKILKIKNIEDAIRIRESFPNRSVDLVLESINILPKETDSDKAIRVQLLELYKSYIAANRPDIFDDEFAEEIKNRKAKELKESFVTGELGKNKEAFNFIRTRFIETLYPLIEFLKVDETTAPKVSRFLDADKKDSKAPSPRSQFEQRMGLLKGQRDLTEVERKYLESVELLSLFNPYLVAAAYADKGVTSEFLRHHFETLSKNTTFNIQDGDYFPLIQIGMGPNGLASLGEIVRNNPDLASSMLVVDAGKQPGGPFAIPEGSAWRLNSASKRGSVVRTLPEKPKSEEEELKTVRAYGSPLRWYPGERGSKPDVRETSINSTVDFLPTPDDLISTARYPTNEELQLILSLQAAVLTKNLALETKVVDVREDIDGPRDLDGNLARKIVTLEIADQTGTRRVNVKTDAIFGATGLGDSGYGFSIFGSRAEDVIRESKRSKGFPKISKTLDAFKAFADRSGEQFSPGETIVIYGGGNSADTLIEYIGSLFQGDNPVVRDIKKVYIISRNDLSSRPRYKLIEDLRGRNGKGNLIEQVRSRVDDIGFDSFEDDVSKRKLAFFNEDGNYIENEKGEVIIADSAIAATGFRSQLDSLFDDYSYFRNLKGNFDSQEFRSPLTLPTNEKISVAETLSNDPNILILGVASNPDFQNVDKLAQLPREAREALLRNGAENAVAIGFRAPDTQAAVNVWLNSRNISVEKKPAGTEREKLLIDKGETFEPGETWWIERTLDPDEIKIPNNIEDEVRLLSPLFIYNIGNAIEMETADGKRFNGELDFTLTYNIKSKALGLEFNQQNKAPIPVKLMEAIEAACVDTDFQKYALVALKKKRRNPKLDITLSFKNGFVDPKTTFVQD